MLGGFLFLIPVMLIHDVNVAALSLAAAFFFVELVVAPIWAVPMDIAPRYSGSASGMMNFGFGVAGIISPLVFGYLIDRTGSWILPLPAQLGCCYWGPDLHFACIRTGHSRRRTTESRLEAVLRITAKPRRNG